MGRQNLRIPVGQEQLPPFSPEECRFQLLRLAQLAQEAPEAAQIPLPADQPEIIQQPQRPHPGQFPDQPDLARQTEPKERPVEFPGIDSILKYNKSSHAFFIFPRKSASFNKTDYNTFKIQSQLERTVPDSGARA